MKSAIVLACASACSASAAPLAFDNSAGLYVQKYYFNGGVGAVDGTCFNRPSLTCAQPRERSEAIKPHLDPLPFAANGRGRRSASSRATPPWASSATRTPGTKTRRTASTDSSRMADAGVIDPPPAS